MTEAGARRRGRAAAKAGHRAAETGIPLTGQGGHHIEAEVLQEETARQGGIHIRPIRRTGRPGGKAVLTINEKVHTDMGDRQAAGGWF